MYALRVPPAHQDHSQLAGGRPLIEITFQLSSAAPGPLSGPGPERRANWAAKLSQGLREQPPLPTLRPCGSTASSPGPRSEGGWQRVHPAVHPAVAWVWDQPRRSTFQRGHLGQATKPRRPQSLSPEVGSEHSSHGVWRAGSEQAAAPLVQGGCRKVLPQRNDLFFCSCDQRELLAAHSLRAQPGPQGTLGFAPPTQLLPERPGRGA